MVVTGKWNQFSTFVVTCKKAKMSAASVAHPTLNRMLVGSVHYISMNYEYKIDLMNELCILSINICIKFKNSCILPMEGRTIAAG